MTKRALTGAQAAAEAMRQINPGVVAAYPITPQTPIVETFAKMAADGLVDTEFVPVESEHSALSVVVGASAAGVRSMTATSSAGLALMFEILGVASGMHLPIVMAISNRALSSPINVHCDHSDTMACRDSGWAQIYSENPQEVYENMLLAVCLAEAAQLPVMVCQDGFITSHCVEAVRVLDDKVVKKFVDPGRDTLEVSSDLTSKVEGVVTKHPLLNLKNPVTYGPLALFDLQMDIKKLQMQAMEKVPNLYLKIGDELSKLTKNSYPYFESYQLQDAEVALVAIGSTAGTVKHVVDRLRVEGTKAGMLKIKLYRPFLYSEIAEALRNVKAIGVLDRTPAYGSHPPLYSDVLNALGDLEKKPKVKSFIYGLGGRDTREEDVEKWFDSLMWPQLLWSPKAKGEGCLIKN